MLRDSQISRHVQRLLKDKTGSGIAEGLCGVAVMLIAVASLGIGVTTNMAAVTTVATKAERQALVTSLVGEKHAGSTWGTPESPNTETVTLPNGNDVEVTTWREETPVSVTLTAVTPISADVDAADCSGPSDIARSGCLYSSRLHAKELDALEPRVIVRKDPSGGTDAPVGTVDSRVATTTSIPQGTTFASGKDDTATVWRYLVNARSLEASGEIRINQGSKVLAKFPVTSSANNYFGTFTADVNVPVTATVTSGNVVVQTIFIYRAGSTS